MSSRVAERNPPGSAAGPACTHEITAVTGAPAGGGPAGTELGALLRGVRAVEAGDEVSAVGVEASCEPVEHPATSTDAAATTTIRMLTTVVRYRRVMHEHTKRVTTSSGVVEGFTRNGVNRWRSIPYAKPPVGPLRFRAPMPAEPWRGVRYCHGFANCAPQQRKYTLTGIGRYQTMGEDCLTLNVVAPEAASDEPLPVMVFVHGGAYILGSSATPIYDGVKLARQGCVYVSVNYRLGALGCLDLSALGTAAHPIDSNLFLRDLVLALSWVRDNIAVFGGDPANVTIFGESAGAHAVTSLLAVPAAEGLFSQVISESPAAGMSSSAEQAAEFANRFAALLGIEASEAARVLRTAPAAELVNAMDGLIAQGSQEMLGAFPAGPTHGDEYLPVEPLEAMRRGSAHRVPLIVGTNAEEARLFTRFLKLLPTTEPMIEALLAEAGPDARARITAAYPDYPRPAACVQLGGDFAFASAAWDIAEAHSRHAPTYLYRYDYAPRTLKWSGLGATHATELLAVFDVYRTRFGSLLTAAGDQRSAAAVTRAVQSRWLEFSRTGVPGGDWPAYHHDDRSVLVFDRRTRVELDPDRDRRSAWSGFSLTS
ncbi:carboxylic ester hydrolase [Mycolicibacterium murale]|uniref:Carboxylic ester hydrolase n=2 Tax=Mycolicibacterium murale TaxID=182220 RepID=A0A7I9WMX9_9MYCO|nr:carboxylic ester hydrolase [Mycolicibacterium murale]